MGGLCPWSRVLSWRECVSDVRCDSAVPNRCESQLAAALRHVHRMWRRRKKQRTAAMRGEHTAAICSACCGWRALLEWSVRRDLRGQVGLAATLHRASVAISNIRRAAEIFSLAERRAVAGGTIVSTRDIRPSRGGDRRPVGRGIRSRSRARLMLPRLTLRRSTLSRSIGRMSAATKNVAVLGSTGSIGTSALEVIDASDGRLRAVALVGPWEA